MRNTAEDAEIAKQNAEAAAQQSDSARIVERYMARIKNRATAIRARCIQCCNGQPSEVAACPATSCALHPFRMGKDPFNKKTAALMARDAEEGDDE